MLKHTRASCKKGLREGGGGQRAWEVLHREVSHRKRGRQEYSLQKERSPDRDFGSNRETAGQSKKSEENKNFANICWQ